MQNFQYYLENYGELAKQPLEPEVRLNLRKFLKSPKDFQILFLVYYLITDAHYRQSQKIYDFITFLYPESEKDPHQTVWGDRLHRFINLALSQFR